MLSYVIGMFSDLFEKHKEKEGSKRMEEREGGGKSKENEGRKIVVSRE